MTRFRWLILRRGISRLWWIVVVWRRWYKHKFYHRHRMKFPCPEYQGRDIKSRICSSTEADFFFAPLQLFRIMVTITWVILSIDSFSPTFVLELCLSWLPSSFQRRGWHSTFVGVVIFCSSNTLGTRWQFQKWFSLIRIAGSWAGGFAAVVLKLTYRIQGC